MILFINLLYNVPNVFSSILPDCFHKLIPALRITTFRYLAKPVAVVLPVLAILMSCSDKRISDPCCTFSDITGNTGVAEGKGMILVEGSTNAYFYVLTESGEQLTYQSLNKEVAVEPGKYQIKVNNSIHSVEIRAGEMAKCSTGTLMVSGNTPEYYYVTDSLGNQLAYETLGKATTWFPGSYTIRVNNTEVSAKIRLKELTEVRTGTVLVKGTTNEYYYVLDHGNKQLNYNALEKPLAFLPGTYDVKVNNTSMKADVAAGKVTELATGNLLVNGLTDEYYYVTDTVGNALNYQSLNKPLAFFPGEFHIKVNNTL